ncbi:MAG: hypothetical protein A2161_00810 [Candidatus Schekmanbacteria bacterium RBG_13_48_7]|uniref:Uncharacterized protein n=1 Tax=Candidatus Schekmanbacteria bacterium RBG_13_48_7 TaxID=1817878 RepID=A0A1F7RI59_9BACT|nr:MAG: hypothetical protein A2161_00810 [Candidatus Schekmanbacteria bacterium RBG_13_48_7]
MSHNKNNRKHVKTRKDNTETKKNYTAKEQGSLSADGYHADDVFENAEPWDPIETKVVIGSLITALIFLIIFGYLINTFILK